MFCKMDYSKWYSCCSFKEKSLKCCWLDTILTPPPSHIFPQFSHVIYLSIPDSLLLTVCHWWIQTILKQKGGLLILCHVVKVTNYQNKNSLTSNLTRQTLSEYILESVFSNNWKILEVVENHRKSSPESKNKDKLSKHFVKLLRLHITDKMIGYRTQTNILSLSDGQ